MRPIRLDDHGQPRSPYLNAGRVADRTVHEMLGLVKGIIADGEVNDAEVVAFRQWLRANPDATAVWPGRVLAERVLAILDDGVIEPEERDDLRQLFRDTVGEPDDQDTTENLPTHLPLTDPVPTILFDGRRFAFTGQFVYGPRARCEQAVIDRGGRCEGAVTGRTDVLVIGTLSSAQWKHTTHGTKIETALALREQGHRIALVCEKDWTDALEA